MLYKSACLSYLPVCLFVCLPVCRPSAPPQPLPNGLLMNYPIFVTEDGAVGALPGVEDFLDIGGKVLGVRSMLPGLLTS